MRRCGGQHEVVGLRFVPPVDHGLRELHGSIRQLMQARCYLHPLRHRSCPRTPTRLHAALRRHHVAAAARASNPLTIAATGAPPPLLAGRLLSRARLGLLVLPLRRGAPRSRSRRGSRRDRRSSRPSASGTSRRGFWRTSSGRSTSGSPASRSRSTTRTAGGRWRLGARGGVREASRLEERDLRLEAGGSRLEG